VTYRVLLATNDPAIAHEFAALSVEAGDIDLVDVAGTTGELMGALAGASPDVIALHDEVGPLPVLDVARDLIGRIPEVGLVMLAHDVRQPVSSAALRAGFRGIIGLPLSLDDLATTVADAGAWSQAVRAKFEGPDASEVSGGGTMLAVAGSKGGVGTTTIALHLALAAAQSDEPRTVCLVDFDLQSGDVRSYLDVTHRWSVADLVDVADDLTGRQIYESMYQHPCGLSVLLPPPRGEAAERVETEKARRILAGIRTRFDVVIVDVGAVMTEGSAVAAEMADQVLLVVTPDIASLRGANRLLALWERLRVREDAVDLVVNRASRKGEIQPELIGKLVDATLLRTTIPADFRALEAATNTGVPDRLDDGRVRRALERLSEELELVPPRRRSAPLRLGRGDRGSASVETAGLALTIGLVVLVLWQLVLIGTTTVLSTHAAREAARELAVSPLPGEGLDARLEEVVRSSLPGGWRDGSVEVQSGRDRVRVRLRVPALSPNWSSPLWITSESGTVLESGRGGTSDLPPESGAAP
jgi:pilus assembly protein CpaE